MTKRGVSTMAAVMAVALGGCSVDVDASGSAVPAGFVGVRPYTTLPASTATAPNVDWGTIPMMYRGRNGLRVRFDCPAGGADGSVWGTDIYTDDSSVCYAAVHFGRIGAAAGGAVVIEIRPGRASYLSTTRNGIASIGYGSYEGSFLVL